MNIERTNKIATILLTIFVPLGISILGAKSTINEFIDVPLIFYNIFLIASLLGVLTAFLLFLIPRITSEINLKREFTCSPARWDQLDDVHLFCKGVLGENVATIQRLRGWYEKNPEVVQIVYEKKNFPSNRLRK